MTENLFLEKSKKKIEIYVKTHYYKLIITKHYVVPMIVFYLKRKYHLVST